MRVKNKTYICRLITNIRGMKITVLTLQERWQATRPNIYKNKKKYARKPKHNKSN